MRKRLRLTAGTLALAFAFLTLLPWAHVFTQGDHGGHRCCNHAAFEQAACAVPALASEDAESPDACWVCGNVDSLFHANVLTGAPCLVRASLSSASAPRAPQAPEASRPVDPACRSQAPPARI